MSSPIEVSAAEIEAVAAIWSLVSTSLAVFSSCCETASTAFSMPRLSAVGFAPAPPRAGHVLNNRAADVPARSGDGRWSRSVTDDQVVVQTPDPGHHPTGELVKAPSCGPPPPDCAAPPAPSTPWPSQSTSVHGLDAGAAGRWHARHKVVAGIPVRTTRGSTSIAGTAPPVVAVVYPGQSELDIGEGLPGASGHKGADFIQSSGRVPVHRARTVPHEARPVLVVRDQMSKLYMTEVALPLEFFTQSRQMPGEPAAPIERCRVDGARRD